MKKKRKKNLRINVSNTYIIIAVFFILGFGFFGTSKLFIAEVIPVNQTELNQEFDLRSNGKFIVNDWIYDEENNRMEIVIVTNGIKDYMSELDFTSVSRKDVKRELPTEVAFSENDIYILHIKDVPKNFEQMAVRLNKSDKNYEEFFNEGIENDEIEGNKRIISTIYTDQREVRKDEVIDKNFKSYALQITDRMINKSTNDIEKIEKNMQAIDKLTVEINEEIKVLKEELLYQTLEEQIDTNNQIYRLERDIEEYGKDKITMNGDINNVNAKIERLHQKKRDLDL